MSDTEIVGTPASTTNPLKGEKRWSYLARAKTIRVASQNEDGSIYLTPIWFVVDNERIFLSLDAGGRHGKNADRPVAALVDTGEEYVMVAGVRIMGRLVPLDDPEEQARLEQKLIDKHFHFGHPHAEQFAEFGEFAGRRFYELQCDRMIGWDSRETTMPQIPEARSLPQHVGDRILN